VLRLEDVKSLRCPACRARVAFRGYVSGDRLQRGELRCGGCAASYEVSDQVARLYREADVRGTDRLLRVVYNGLPAVHDPLVRFSFPWAVGETEEESRARTISKLGLTDLVSEATGRVVRVLEIGAGTGSNVPVLRAMLPPSMPIEVWAVDLSLGMIRLFQQRMRFLGDGETRVLAADAHALPFPDGFFDRVFHVGAINGYRDPRRALAEMARVARAATPIVVVDERLDPDRTHGLAHRLFFRWLTIYDRNPHAPIECLPPDAEDVSVEQMGRFFYCMTFRSARS
jgi:SAM-dependent methyltransferase